MNKNSECEQASRPNLERRGFRANDNVGCVHPNERSCKGEARLSTHARRTQQGTPPGIKHPAPFHSAHSPDCCRCFYFYFSVFSYRTILLYVFTVLFLIAHSYLKHIHNIRHASRYAGRTLYNVFSFFLMVYQSSRTVSAEN